jgi:sterol 3beta-glucosyltransferase
LRHGKPTVVVPFFADQPFWGARVHHLDVGPLPIPFARLTIENLADAIDSAVNDPIFLRKAEILGDKLQREDGVGKAVRLIQAYLASNLLAPPKVP